MYIDDGFRGAGVESLISLPGAPHVWQVAMVQAAIALDRVRECAYEVPTYSVCTPRVPNVPRRGFAQRILCAAVKHNKHCFALFWSKSTQTRTHSNVVPDHTPRSVSKTRIALQYSATEAEAIFMTETHGRIERLTCTLGWALRVNSFTAWRQTVLHGSMIPKMRMTSTLRQQTCPMRSLSTMNLIHGVMRT